MGDEETSTIQVPHHQSVPRHKSKLVADFGLMMHLTWARQLLDNREFVLVGAPPGLRQRTKRSATQHTTKPPAGVKVKDPQLRDRTPHACAPLAPRRKPTR